MKSTFVWRARAIVAAFDRCGSGVSVVQNVRLKMCAMCGSKNINRILCTRLLTENNFKINLKNLSTK